MIHVFHGFLGSPEDFSFLPQREDIKLYDLLDLKSLPTLDPDDILIGYSMGGRIALELASQNNYEIKKLVLISSHPGLATQEERDKRIVWEDEVLTRLNEAVADAFEQYWNALTIFSHDKPIEIKRMADHARLFDQFRLSQQKNFLTELPQYKEKLLWIMGEKDEKYLKLAQEELLPMGIAVRFIDGGHRLFQNSEALLEVLNEEGIL